MARTFAKDAIMAWDGNRITDHNRSDLAIDYDRIETVNRMANGAMRRYIVADKRKFSVSWDNLPNSAQHTVDGFWGGDEIENWWLTKTGSFILKITHADGESETFTVMMTSFSKDIKKRGIYEILQVNVELEEV